MKKYFFDYGYIEWLEPEEYYAGNWKYMRTKMDADDEEYDLVINPETDEWRCTHV